MYYLDKFVGKFVAFVKGAFQRWQVEGKSQNWVFFQVFKVFTVSIDWWMSFFHKKKLTKIYMLLWNIFVLILIDSPILEWVLINVFYWINMIRK